MPKFPHLRVSVAESLSAIAPDQWNACANPQIESDFNQMAPTIESNSHLVDSNRPLESIYETIESHSQGERYNPFISYAFLRALEVSGSVGHGTGWTPAYLVLDDDSGILQAAAPSYVKSHSMGEYVFDQGWARAYEQAGGHYYPKLQVSVPFTPATGRRLLTRKPALVAPLIEGLRSLRASLKASSIHATFLPEPEADALGEAGFLRRTDQQFHFFNRGYADFEAFLAALSSRKRKMIKRERAQALSPGISIEWLTGKDIQPQHWDAFFAFYMDTGARKWGRPYLTRRFFDEIGTTMPQDILLIMAKRDGKYIAGAINFIGKDALYGRNWGALEHHPFLHFEVCYYQAIEFALSRGLKRVEAGAQGEHKLARGYEPVITHSAHDIADMRFRRAVADYLEAERAQTDEHVAILGEHTPFRRSDHAPAHALSEQDMDEE